MKQNPHIAFPYAEQVLGYRLSQHKTGLTSTVEDETRDVIEVTAVWAGRVQRVQHLNRDEGVEGVCWSGEQAYFKAPTIGTVMVETPHELEVWEERTDVILLDRNAIVHVKNGLHHTMYRRVSAAIRVVPDSQSWIDLSFLAVLGVSGAIGLMVALLISLLPNPPALEATDIGERFAKVLLVTEKKQQLKPRPKPTRQNHSAETSRSDSPAKTSKRQGGGNQKRYGERRAKNMKTVQNAGLIAALNRTGALSNMAMDDGLISAIRGFPGGKTASSGVGLGSRQGGFGQGPGVDGSIGELNSVMGTAGAVSGRGLCDSSAMACEKQAMKGTVQTAPSITIGSLSRDEVDAVIKRNLKRIKYCYQKELQQTPELSGKILSFFTIGKDGSVSTARVKMSTLKSTKVDQCILNTLYRLQFPKPRGGGHVTVTYPFSFQAV